MIANLISILTLGNAGAPVPPPPTDLIWNTTDTNWELTDVNWEG